MGRKAASKELVEECIFTALMILMEKEDYDSITITDITKRAGVSRMSYYRLYHSKDDIMIGHLRGVFEKIEEQVKEQKITTEREFFFCYYQEVQNNMVFLKNVVRAGMMEQVWRIMKSYALSLHTFCFGPEKTDKEERYRLGFLVGGILLITREWLESGMKESVDEMADFTCRAVRRLVELKPGRVKNREEFHSI